MQKDRLERVGPAYRLVPFFRGHRLSEITVREVDATSSTRPASVRRATRMCRAVESFASLRVAAGDDPVHVSSHEDPTFTLKRYGQVVKHRERLTVNERKAFDQAVE
jgi:hypothetical protein